MKYSQIYQLQSTRLVCQTINIKTTIKVYIKKINKPQNDLRNIVELKAKLKE